MLKPVLAACVALVLGGALSAAPAAGAQGEAADIDAARARQIIMRLQQARPDLEYSDVTPSPLPGIYQVQIVGGPMLYVVNDGEYFFDGNLYAVRPGAFLDVRDAALVKPRKEMMAAIPRNSMIIFSPTGETRAVINVFTDVDCGFCRKLHQEVPQLNSLGIEVRYLAFPRAGPDSESYRKIATAWCAKNPQETLTRLKNGEAVPIDVCANNPVAEQFQLGQQAGVNGTPAIVLMDGTLLPGYRPANVLAQILGLNPGDNRAPH